MKRVSTVFTISISEHALPLLTILARHSQEIKTRPVLQQEDTAVLPHSMHLHAATSFVQIPQAAEFCCARGVIECESGKNWTQMDGSWLDWPLMEGQTTTNNKWLAVVISFVTFGLCIYHNLLVKPTLHCCCFTPHFFHTLQAGVHRSIDQSVFTQTRNKHHCCLCGRKKNLEWIIC